MLWRLGIVAIVASIIGGLGVLLSYLDALRFTTNRIDERVVLDRSPADIGIDYEAIVLRTEDGFNIAGWMVASSNRAAVILLHDYKANRQTLLPYIGLLASAGYGVLAIDLRAHGESEGERITLGVTEVNDVAAAHAFLRERANIDPARIGLLGIGQGGTTAILYASTNMGIAALAADSAYADFETFLLAARSRTVLPLMVLAPLFEQFLLREVRADLRDVSAIAHIDQATSTAFLFIQGGKDIVIPTTSATRLHAAAPEPKDVWIVAGAPYVGGYTTAPRQYDQRLNAFLAKHLLASTTL